MKRIVGFIFLCVLAMTATAQTYNNGVWYSLFDETAHTMNTQGDYETGNVFAPTAGTLNVRWKYEWIDWLGAFRKIDTDVLESSNGGSSTKQVGSLAENTDKNSQTTESFNLSRNINWIKFNRSGAPTHKVILQHLDIPLAKHILLASGDYGASSATHAFETIEAYAVSEAYHVNLRSFLTAGDITVTSSLPNIFRVGAANNTTGLNYAVGANACASANGTAATAGGASLGKIANYGFDIYFTPTEAKSYEAVITITDGVSTATVTVSGTATAPLQPIDVYYNYEHAMCAGEEYTDENFAQLTESGQYTDTLPNQFGGDSIITLTLTVNPVYHFEDSLTMLIGEEGLWQSVDLSLLPAGDTVLLAPYQTVTGCDSTYVLYLTVKPRITTYGTDTVHLCAGESYVFEDKTYRRTTTDSVLLAEPNVYGGDSIIELVVYVYPVISIEASATIIEGEQETWQGYDLSEMTVGDTTLVATYVSEHGCDSTYVLYLTVEQNTEGLNDLPTDNARVRKVVHNGQVLIRKGDAWYDLMGRKQE